ncbi:MAG: phage major capsid protein [Lachnospiraceae bacterium]|nr:phage major capsid protein [Lachnospiraceae bacterium]
MLKNYPATIQIKDAKAADKRRFRNILAASGQILESGEVRDLEHLYVMGRDRKLILVSSLDKNPDNQTEKYSLKLQADHGEFDAIEEMPVPTVEKVFGDCKVWMDDDGLHARAYFGTNKLADHCWGISENASYSIGAEWYDDGYYGAGNEIDGPVGILREISMVVTGNDPSAMTIDTKTSKDASGAAEGEKNKEIKKGNTMSGTTKSADALTPDERDALGRELLGVIDKFTTNVPESETQPTARDAEDNQDAEKTEDTKTEGDNTTEAPAAKTKDTLHSPVVIIRDKVAHQEADVKKTTDWRFSAEAKRKFADMLYENGGTGGTFASDWAKELKKHSASTHDGITGLSLPTDGDKLFINAIEKSDGLLQHVNIQNRKTLPVEILSALGADTGAETARAHGFKKGDEKMFQELAANGRQVYAKMIYKMLDLDATEIYENPDLVEVRAQELVESLIVEYERSFTIGDGRSAPTGDNPDLRTFDGTRGFYSIVADAAAAAGSNNVGQFFAKAISLPSTATLFDASIEAESEIDADGGLIYVVKKDVLKNFRKAKDADGRLIVPLGVSMEDALQAKRVYAPSWMKFATVDVIVFADKSYTMIGESNPRMKPSFDVRKNQDILLVEQHRGGSLSKVHSAVTITFDAAAGSNS